MLFFEKVRKRQKSGHLEKIMASNKAFKTRNCLAWITMTWEFITFGVRGIRCGGRRVYPPPLTSQVSGKLQALDQDGHLLVHKVDVLGMEIGKRFCAFKIKIGL